MRLKRHVYKNIIQEDPQFEQVISEHEQQILDKLEGPEKRAEKEALAARKKEKDAKHRSLQLRRRILACFLPSFAITLFGLFSYYNGQKKSPAADGTSGDEL
mmetsp:Transcript_24349/g.75164  ORF Transcript_24349/g.75164 Transcript_24349/m.75164 type:complete len:102 (-) Transcript_24349:380-685(-)